MQDAHRIDYTTEDGILKALHAAHTLLDILGSLEELWINSVRDTLNRVTVNLIENTDLITDKVLSAMTDLTMDSPYKDINDQNGVRHHEQHPAQDVCLIVIRSLVALTHFTADTDPQTSRKILKILNKIAGESLDWDIRKESLSGLIYTIGQKSGEARLHAVENLEQHAKTNSDFYLRRIARDGLIDIARADNTITSRAIAAQKQGVTDIAPENRMRALGMLINRVKSPSCPLEEVEELRRVFESAASVPDEPPINRECALAGLTEAEGRLNGRFTLQITFP